MAIDVHCTDAAADQALLQNAIDGGGVVAVHGHCLGNWQISAPVTLTGVGGAMLDGGYAGRVLIVEPSVTATISGLVIENGTAPEEEFPGGGGIDARDGSTVVVNNSSITGNSAYDGGGIAAGPSASVSVAGSSISRNSAFDGGGIDVIGASLTVVNSSIGKNTVTGTGAGIRSLGSEITLADTRVSTNTAGESGGGISAYDDTGQGLTLANTTVDHNTAEGGAGISHAAVETDSSVTLNSSTIAFNRDVGGGSFGGGGLWNYARFSLTASVTASNSSFVGNIARAGVGGAIDNQSDDGSALVTLWNTTVSSGAGFLNPNQARYGGGIYNTGGRLDDVGIGAVLTLEPGGDVVHNLASVDGGGVYNTNGGRVVLAGGKVILNIPNNCVDC